MPRYSPRQLRCAVVLTALLTALIMLALFNLASHPPTRHPGPSHSVTP